MIPVPPEYNELLTRTVEIVAEEAKRAGMDDEGAVRMALATVERLCAEIGGGQVYFPKGEDAKIARRNGKIWAEFTGKPEDYARLAKKFDLTEMQIRNVIARERARDAKTRQGQMFM